MNVFDIWATMTYLLLDVCASLSVLGSFILAVGWVVSARLGVRFRAPEQVYVWAGSCTFLGILGLISITVSDQITVDKTPFMSLSLTTVGLMLTVSVLLLIGGKILQVKSRRVTFAKPRRYINQIRW